MTSRKALVLLGGLALLIVAMGGLVAGGALLDRPTRQPEPQPTTAVPPSPTLAPVARVTVVPRAEQRATATATAASPVEATETAPGRVTSAPIPTPSPQPTDAPAPVSTSTSSPPSTAATAPTPTPSPQPTDSQTPTPRSTVSAQPTEVATHIPTATSAPLPSSTPSLSPTDAQPSTFTPTPSPLPTDAPTLTPSPQLSGRVSGRMILGGSAVDEGVHLMLEDQSYNVIAETTVQEEGLYVFTDLPPSSTGYNVLFAQEWNEEYGIDQVVSWGWIGPIAVESEEVVALPDFEISLQDFRPLKPEPEASFSASALSADNPIVFEWKTYPEADTYWVDLARGAEQELVWQSEFTEGVSVSFAGILDSGARIQPGEHWWGVGAQKELGTYTLTLYGYLSRLLIEP